MVHVVHMSTGSSATHRVEQVQGQALFRRLRVTARQIRQLGITITPKHPEKEMRKVGGNFEAQTAPIEMTATHVVVDGNIVTGQNQNSGYETSHRILELLANGRSRKAP